MQKCAYIYIHMSIFFNNIHCCIYIYIYHSISCLSNSRILIADICCFIHPYITFREGRPLHVERASQINAAPVFSPSELSPKNMEVLGSWEPWDNTLWNKLWITCECMGVYIYIEREKYVYIYNILCRIMCVYIDGHIRITGSYDFCVSSKHTWGNDGEHLIYTWITWRMWETEK